MKNNHERGIAMVLALFLMSAMSVLATSLMFLSQTETYASMNYRMMSQSRYAGEAAVQKAADFLLDPTQYQIPGHAGDPLVNYDFDSSPVTYGGNPVVLSAVDGCTGSNYPAAAVQTAFCAAAADSLGAGDAELAYSAKATLIAMRQFDAYGGTQNVVQTWEVLGIGEQGIARTATVEVLATIETPRVPANNYAAFAVDDSCGAMYFHGNVTINSYDSRVAGGPGASIEDEGGDVGTNGNLQIQGSVEVQGNLYTPRTGVGSCEEGAVTALTETGSADVTGSIIQLPTAVTYPLPQLPPSLPRNLVTIDSAATLATACATLGVTTQPGVTCSVSGSTITIDGNGNDVNLPSVSIGGGYTLVLVASPTPGQTININSLTGSGDLEINTAAAGESVVMRVAGLEADNTTEMAVPIDLELMSWKQNASGTAQTYDASAFQLVYGGSATLNMKGGNSQSAMTIYAPNADFELKGTQDLYGSVLARTIENHGNASIHYDRSLAEEHFVAGRPMIGTFTWKRF
jgi:hypothetical protein